ncbi:hypothetical protein [Legionella gresilensis]|uniref:hypothetical protein n=1 Tax=Legionella gresilensis TaxID=91823 RepID=UPI00104190AC|nr:hypothetical protein [Legionella gresilensis]
MPTDKISINEPNHQETPLATELKERSTTSAPIATTRFPTQDNLSNQDLAHMVSRFNLFGETVSKGKQATSAPTQTPTVLTGSTPRVFLHGEELKGDVLKTYERRVIGKETKHFVTINNQEREVYTYAQKASHQLFLNNNEIIDKEILKTHTVEGQANRKKQHYVIIGGVKTLVLSLNQYKYQKELNRQARLRQQFSFVNSQQNKKDQREDKADEYPLINGRRKRELNNSSGSSHKHIKTHHHSGIFSSDTDVSADNDFSHTDMSQKI